MYNLNELNNTILALDRELIGKISEFDRYSEQLEAIERKIASNEDNIDKHIKAAHILQKTADKQREHVKNRIETLGTAALQSIFGQQYELSIELDQQKAKPECKIYVVETHGETTLKREPQDFTGGGIVDIVSIALRFAVIQLLREYSKSDAVNNIHGVLQIVLLDEPGKHVSKEYSPLLSEFIKLLSTSLNMQIIFITHNDFMCNNSTTITEVEKIGETSIAKQIMSQQ